MSEPQAPELEQERELRVPDFCPRCGTAYEPLQEYCLECGARLPTNQGVTGSLARWWQRRLAWYPGDWIWPVLLFLVLTVVATALAIAVGSHGSPAAASTLVATRRVPLGPGSKTGSVAITTAKVTITAPEPTVGDTSTLPQAPGAPSGTVATTPAPRPNPNALVEWPAAKSGYTAVLESIPVQNGRPAALARARAAKANGITQVGLLVSSHYSSLHPGYYVVFAGVFGSNAQAQTAASQARARGFRDAYPTRVTP